MSDMQTYICVDKNQKKEKIMCNYLTNPLLELTLRAVILFPKTKYLELETVRRNRAKWVAAMQFISARAK